MRIAIAQINSIVGDLIGNKKSILNYIQKASTHQTDIVVFPELCVTGYPPEDLLHKDHFIENNLNVIKEIIPQTKKITAVVGFVDRDKDKKLFNAAAILSDGRARGVYYKQHLPNYSVFDEKRYFDSGVSDMLISHNKIKVGVNICEDIWVEEGAFMRQAKQGASVLINISSSPYEAGKVKTRDELIAARAKQAKAYVVYVNMVGGQDELIFDGSSIVASPEGEIIHAAVQFDEDLVVIDIPAKAKKIRTPKTTKIIEVFSDTKKKSPLTEKYPYQRIKVIEEVYCALVLGTRDYIHKNGFKKVCIGLSGGIDSALVAAIACDAIGKNNVVGISMPSQYTSKGTQSDAKTLANNLGIKFLEVPIEKTFKSFQLDLKQWFKKYPPNVTEENLQARVRGNLLMAFSNKFNWLVLTTGNKSEMAVGYCTLYGDMSGGFAVIKDIVKTKVYKLARFRNQLEGSDLIPQSIIDRAPSAELRPNQKDQDSLPPYETLDKIVVDYVENHLSYKEISKSIDEATVKKVIQLIDRSEYKRRQGPPGVKITPRAFGKDWRLPITNQYKPF